MIAPDFSCVMLLLYQRLAVERKLALHHEVFGCSERRMQLDCRDVVVVVRDYHIQKRPKTSIMAKERVGEDTWWYKFKVDRTG